MVPMFYITYTVWILEEFEYQDLFHDHFSFDAFEY